MGWFSDSRRFQGGISFAQTRALTSASPIEPLFRAADGAPPDPAPLRPADGGIDRSNILERLTSQGIQAPGLATALRAGLRWMIVNGLETAPCATARSRLLIERAVEVVDAVAAVGSLIAAASIHMVVDEALGAVIRELHQRTRVLPVTIVPAEDHYPQDHPRLLFQLITGHAVPVDRAPPDLGAWIVDVETLMEIRGALAGQPAPRMSLATVSGDVVQRPGNYWIPRGTTVGAVLQRVGTHKPPARLVLGSAMVGALARGGEELVPPLARGVFAWSQGAVPDRQATGCVRCGLCVECCPVGIEPITIYNAVESPRTAQAARLWPEACIDCGLCDYVCPSYLPLMQGVRAARLIAGRSSSDARPD